MDDEEEGEEEEEDKEIIGAKKKKIKTIKDPTVDTSFLPDRDREEMERIQREQLRKEWLKRQEEIKSKFFFIIQSNPIQIMVYYIIHVSYMEGEGHSLDLVVCIVIIT